MRFGWIGSLMSSSRPYPAHAPPARPIAGYSVMSWHCVGPVGTGLGPSVASMMCGSASRTIALSAAVGAPVRAPRAHGHAEERVGVLLAQDLILAVHRHDERALGPRAVDGLLLGRDVLRRLPVLGGRGQVIEDPGELTMAACSGCASGTLMTSIRNSAELESRSGVTPTQPDSSLGERTVADPEM